jgi:predicted metalloendopeptidase
MKRAIPFALLALAALAQKPSLNRADLDPACQPCQDFWRFANGGWVDKNPIPARFARWGTLPVLTEANRERLKAILEEAAADTAAPVSSPRRKIGDFYASCMDTEGIESRGTKPIQPDLARIASVRSAGGIGASITEFQRRGGIGPFVVTALQDLKNSKEMIAYIAPGALSLPDRDYYFKDDDRSKLIRAEFVKHVEKMLALLGDKPEAAAAAAKKVLEFETALAEVMLTNVQRRDPYAGYHRMDFAGLAALAPGYEWKELFKQMQLPETTPINVSEPEFLKKFDAQLKALPVDDWKTWLRWRVLNAAAPHLNKAFVDQDFAFSGTVLTGVTEQLPRWQNCAATVDRQLGEALGRLFVEKHFPPAARQRMKALVENLRAALREELTNAAWLAPETRQNAVAKLNAFVAKIGHPERWRAYAAVKPTRQSYFENVKMAGIENRNYRLSKIGKPIDRNEWGMTTPTVNAYYSPLMNEIVFPAGILQPPLFDMAAGDEINYGAIGAVIGHEMGHGFDDQGSKFDAEGNLKNWWTDEDRAKFDARAGCVIDEYNKLDVGEGLHHNGKLVVGEAMGDLGGLTLAYKAWRRALRGKPEPPVVDGFTAEQRFFLSFARVWATVDRPESTRLRLNTDPHPLPKFRANGTLMNMPEFQKAFGCKAGDAMVRPAAVQCKLW